MKKKETAQEQSKEDYWHLKDVEQRLTDGEIEIDGRPLNDKEVEAYMRAHAKRITQLGRVPLNPFDTIRIIESERSKQF